MSADLSDYAKTLRGVALTILESEGISPSEAETFLDASPGSAEAMRFYRPRHVLDERAARLQADFAPGITALTAAAGHTLDQDSA